MTSLKIWYWEIKRGIFDNQIDPFSVFSTLTPLNFEINISERGIFGLNLIYNFSTLTPLSLGPLYVKRNKLSKLFRLKLLKMKKSSLTTSTYFQWVVGSRQKFRHRQKKLEPSLESTKSIWMADFILFNARYDFCLYNLKGWPPKKQNC